MMKIFLTILLFFGSIALWGQAQYVGSERCKTCHPAMYERWSKTRMANVVRDPKVHPEAVTPDLSKPDPLLTFTIDDIAWVYGSKWKQRYFAKRGDDHYLLGGQWDLTNRIWRPAATNMQRPTSQMCDGCHSVNFNIRTKAVTEWNVGCEKCHGPGAGHVARPSQTNIVNPARLDSMQATNVCVQCHSEGQALMSPIDGKDYDWPVGFQVGMDLKDFWKLEKYKLGEQTSTHFADGSAHKNRMQGNDFVQSAMYTHGVSCGSCHDVHGTANNADLLKPANVMCLQCHGPKSPNGPRGATVQEHTHHTAGSAGNECASCHMPKIAQEIADVNVRSHTFRFIPPAETEELKVPNACTSCHAGRSNQWAKDELQKWTNVSPWRVAR